MAWWLRSNMLAALIIVFRETMEAGLVVGIVLGATRGVLQRGRFVSYGIFAGLVGACVVAGFASKISDSLAGNGQEIFNATVLIIAVFMLAGHNIWMARHGRQIAAEMREMGAAVQDGRRSLIAMAVVVGTAVLREGSETVLFLYGVTVAGKDSSAAMAVGGAIGLVLAVAVTAVTYFGLAKIPSKNLFKVTSWLIALLAAGMAAQAVVFLQQAGVVNMLPQIVWDSSHVLSNGSLIGKALHTLIGYTDRPSLMQVVVYVVTVVVIFSLMRMFAPGATNKIALNAATSSFTRPGSPGQARG